MIIMKEEMDVISFRVPKRIKKGIRNINVNWSQKVRTFLEEELKRDRRKRALREIVESMKDMPEPSAGTAAKLIREDRDSH